MAEFINEETHTEESEGNQFNAAHVRGVNGDADDEEEQEWMFFNVGRVVKVEDGDDYNKGRLTIGTDVSDVRALRDSLNGLLEEMGELED